MKRVAAIGDNCIDCYKRLGRKYPTGNVVDTAVNLRRLGQPVAVISTTGSDKNGEWMRATLEHEGLDLSHFKTGDGPTAITYMDMNGPDRVHGDYVEGVLADIVFDAGDVAFAAKHDLVHSAFWGKAENVLDAIKKGGAVLSFDFADRLDAPLVDRLAPIVDYGFFSYKKKRDAFIEEYLRRRTEVGMKVAVATFGENGSLAYDGQQYHQFGAIPATVVNTVGAGDSFIAGFLWGILNGHRVPAALAKGACVAAGVVSVFEPWVNCR